METKQEKGIQRGLYVEVFFLEAEGAARHNFQGIN